MTHNQILIEDLVELINEHGGIVHVDSRVGAGSTFEIELPI